MSGAVGRAWGHTGHLTPAHPLSEKPLPRPPSLLSEASSSPPRFKCPPSTGHHHSLLSYPVQWLSGAPLKYARVLTSETCESDLFWERGFCRCNEGKDLQMRFSRVIRVGPKFSQCSQRRPREERATCSQKQRWELCDPELRNSGSPRSWEKRREGRREPSREQACPHLGLDSGLRPLEPGGNERQP